MVYVLLLRGINVGEKQSIYEWLKKSHSNEDEEFEEVDSYINRGNLFFKIA